MRSGRRPQTSSVATPDLPQLGETLRRRRLERGLEVEDAARELGIPAKALRAIEWDRGDLLGSVGEAARIERRYAEFLGLMVAPPAVEEPPPAPPASPAPPAPLAPSPTAAPAPSRGAAPAPSRGAAPAPSRGAAPAAWLPLLATLPLPLVIVLVALVAETPLLTVMLVLTVVSAVLLAGALAPPGILARAHVPDSTFARWRQPLALSAIGILAPVTLAAVLTALS